MSNISTTPLYEREGSHTSIGTGVNLLVFIFYGAMTVILVAIFVQRALLRIVPKYSKGHADVGKFAPKSLKANIDERLQRTLYVAFDPTLLFESDKRCEWLSQEQPGVDETMIEQQALHKQYNYLYRMKAVDDIKKLESALTRTDGSLKRHPFKGLNQHLRDVKSHSSGVMRTVRSSQMKALTDSYEHARYKQEVFGKKEYEKFTEILNSVLSGIEHKSKKKRSRKQHSQRNSNNSNSEDAALERCGENVNICTISENEPLLVQKEDKK